MKILLGYLLSFFILTVGINLAYAQTCQQPLNAPLAFDGGNIVLPNPPQDFTQVIKRVKDLEFHTTSLKINPDNCPDIDGNSGGCQTIPDIAGKDFNTIYDELILRRSQARSLCRRGIDTENIVLPRADSVKNLIQSSAKRLALSINVLDAIYRGASYDVCSATPGVQPLVGVDNSSSLAVRTEVNRTNDFLTEAKLANFFWNRLYSCVSDLCKCPQSYRWDATAKKCVTGIVICPGIYEPVCGCDGVTYSSGCDANSKGVKSYTNGECGRPASSSSDSPVDASSFGLIE